MDLSALHDMTPTFVNYIGATVVKEGGERYTNDPADRGGPTKWGITQVRARAAGFSGDMRSMTRDEAMCIYWVFFWVQPGYDKVNAVAPSLAASMLDLGVNNGTGWPGKWLQRALNVLNQQAVSWPDITVDGGIGLMTVGALKALIAVRGSEGVRVLDRILHAFAGVRYVELAEDEPTQERFEFGWLSQRAFPVEKITGV